jgi:pSer/pThr/pTyr-binding forkhead associated (FHA) protein
MPEYYRDPDNEIVTIFSRAPLRPSLERAGQIGAEIPDTIYFVTTDGTEFALDSNSEIVIGRRSRPDDPPVSVDLEAFNGHAMGVSRHHAMIKKMHGRLILVDLDSINGTLVNGQRALPLKRYALQDGDMVTVGRLLLELIYTLPGDR